MQQTTLQHKRYEGQLQPIPMALAKTLGLVNVMANYSDVGGGLRETSMEDLHDVSREEITGNWCFVFGIS